MPHAAVARADAVLVDALPGALVRDAIAVTAAVVLTALSAQVVIPLPFTPVPLTGQTFAVLLTGAALGTGRGALAQGLYVGVGLAGAPVFADGSHGIDLLFGATGGYLIGFVAAAAVVGALARRGMDRRVVTTAVAFVIGSAVIYLFGATGLALSADLGPAQAFELGVRPFLVGDLVKAAVAGGLLPAAWWLLRDR